MAEPTNDLRYMPASSNSARRSGPNVSSGWIVMILSALIAAVAFLYLTNQADKSVAVLVASHDIQAGELIDQSDFRSVKVSLDASQVNRLMRFEDRTTVNGFTSAGPIKEGDFVPKVGLVPPATKENQRAMSLPIDKTRAVNGVISVGDTVDVVFGNEKEGQFIPRYIPDLQVLAVSEGGGGALAGGGTFTVTVAVEPDEAEDLNEAINSAKFDVIRSTSAKPVNNSGVSNTTPAA